MLGRGCVFLSLSLSDSCSVSVPERLPSCSGVTPARLRTRLVHSSCNSKRIGAIRRSIPASFSTTITACSSRISKRFCSFFAEIRQIFRHSLSERRKDGSPWPSHTSAMRSRISQTAPYPAGPARCSTSDMAGERQNMLGCFIQRMKASQRGGHPSRLNLPVCQGAPPGRRCLRPSMRSCVVQALRVWGNGQSGSLPTMCFCQREPGREFGVNGEIRFGE